jgi:purine-nucleoside phosphorylase
MDIKKDSNIFETASQCAEYVRHLLPLKLQNPAVGIICGSGLGGLADAVQSLTRVEVSYQDIPQFPRSTS